MIFYVAKCRTYRFTYVTRDRDEAEEYGDQGDEKWERNNDLHDMTVLEKTFQKSK